MDVNIFIFAGGENPHWEGDESKEIVTVNSMPVITRTIWQVRGMFKQEPIVISHKPDVQWVAKENHCRVIDTKHDCLIESIMAQPWGKYNCVLLGDVYYTDDALHQIFGVYRFAYGNEVELFALRWVAPDKRIDSAFQITSAHFRNENGHGKLWETYRALHGKPLNEHWLGGSLLLIEDETTDFDTIEHYHEWLERTGYKS